RTAFPCSPSVAGPRTLPKTNQPNPKRFKMDTRLPDLLHSLHCTKDHDCEMTEIMTGRIPGCCYYYLEKSLTEDSELLLDTNYWENQAKELCQSLDTTPMQTIRLIYKILEAKGILTIVLEENPKIQDLARKLLCL
ncbi:MAG: hypothetical protein RR609_09415, partial [Aurantimicrobium sp.]